MKRLMTVPIAICIASFLVIGCATSPEPVPASAPPEYVLTGGLVKAGYAIADTLVSQSKVPMGENDAVIVASFVNINNLQESSTQGRMLAEHVASRLSQRGYKVIDMRLRMDSVFMEEGKGEFLLSRNLRNVSKAHNASAVVVGTYGEALYGTYVSARIINPADNTIISSADYGMVLGRDAPEYLKRNK
ncbi:MAG TPA: FlgO family outer membrane protein [Syntrophales bacterium]|nr:FlgO family outer membrane protein [Syntrophales bacterium]